MVVSCAMPRHRIVLSIVTALLLIMFALHLAGTIRMDGYAIALLVLALLPWCVPFLPAAFRSIGEALNAANLKSFEIGGLKIEQLERKIEEHSQILDEQRRIIDDLVVYSMAFYIYDKLKYLHIGSHDPQGPYREYKYVKDEAFDHDLRYLRDHGYLNLFMISDLQPGENLVGKLQVTEMGRRFVEMKEARASTDRQ
jgi:hypothetical protein